jgi:hypothetical protein
MAHSFNRLTTRHTTAEAFDFISDFRHASLWDPNTRSVTMLTDTPIRQGSKFRLEAALLLGSVDLPYEIEVYERPKRLVFVGKTWWVEYHEQITFIAEGSGTVIEYDAHMSLRSLLGLGNLILSLVYQRIGDSATSGIVASMDRALG